MEIIVQDIRYAIRSLRRTPAVTIVAIVTLALGIGANTAIFSVVNRLLFHPFPFLDDGRLVAVWSAPQGNDHNEVSRADFHDWRTKLHSFDRLVAHAPWTVNLTGGERPERVQAYRVSPAFFETLGLRPLLGRTFTAGEDEPGSDRLVVLSYGLWQRRYGGDPSVLGRTLAFNGVPRVVVGVMPQGVTYPADAEAWSPLDAVWSNRRGHFLLVTGRLAPGVSIDAARAELAALSATNEVLYPETNTGWRSNVQPLVADNTRMLRPMLLVLFGAVGFVLLIACANVANLMLARAASRRRELAIRSALGAARARISRLLLTESLILALAGGAAGVVLGVWGVDLLAALVPSVQQRVIAGFDRIRVDVPVLMFTLLLSLASALLFGLVPALRAGRSDGNEAMRSGGSSESRDRHRLRRGLVAAEVALALLLLVGAGLTWRTFRYLASVEPGFNGDGIALTSVVLPYRTYDSDSVRRRFIDALLARVAALPGVRVAGLANIVPLCSCNGTTGFEVVGAPPYAAGERPEINWRVVSPGYFTALRMPLRRGRLIEDRDGPATPGVVVVNETLSKRWFPGEGALGKLLYVDGDTTRPVQVVGIVGDIRHAGLAQPVQPELYVPMAQRPSNDMTILARTDGDPAALLPGLRAAVQAIDRDQPVYDQRTMRDVMNLAMGPYRFSMRLLAGLGVIALVLAGVGIYGVIAHLVAQRTREIGIRMALGGNEGSVRRLVVRQGMMPALAGLGIGTVLALVLTQAMTKMMVGVSPRDPVTYAGVAVVLMAVALLACWAPARRAARVDPMIALRND